MLIRKRANHPRGTFTARGRAGTYFTTLPIPPCETPIGSDHRNIVHLIKMKTPARRGRGGGPARKGVTKASPMSTLPLFPPPSSTSAGSGGYKRSLCRLGGIGVEWSWIQLGESAREGRRTANPARTGAFRALRRGSFDRSAYAIQPVLCMIIGRGVVRCSIRGLRCFLGAGYVPPPIARPPTSLRAGWLGLRSHGWFYAGWI